MSAAHTPAPWVFDGEPHNIVVWSGPHDRVCFLTSDGPNEANARLIAAAPDLLEALKPLAEAYLDAVRSNAASKRNPENDAEYRDALAAIARATGAA